MIKLAVTGTTGLVGLRLKTLLKDKYEIIELSRSSGVNLLDKDSISSVLTREKPDVVLHLAAKTNVDECERDKEEDLKKINEMGLLTNESLTLEKLDEKAFNVNNAFATNTIGSKNIAEITEEVGAKLIYVSTDFIFDGKEDFYTEESKPMPINWYGQTKYWGEILSEMCSELLIIRPSYPYGYSSAVKKDFLWTLIELFKSQTEISLVGDYIITPTFIDDIVLGIEFSINSDLSGIFNLCGGDSKTSFEIGKIISKGMGFGNIKINKTTGEEFYKDRARRPFKTIMKNDKLERAGFKTKTFIEAFNLILRNPSKGEKNTKSL